jgi:predicted Rossmann fold flavoprotein
MLQISSYWREGETIHLDFVPIHDADSLLRSRKRERPQASLRNIVAEVLPVRLAHRLAENYPDGGIAGMADRVLSSFASRLKHWPVQPSGSEGWAKAEVTVGGVDTGELSSRTMESRKIPGLYFIGEAVDVTGWLGGYNFQWAWSSGWTAGQFV